MAAGDDEASVLLLSVTAQSCLQNVATQTDAHVAACLLSINVLATYSPSRRSPNSQYLASYVHRSRPSYPAAHLKCIKDPLYHDACISISDGVLVRVCSWSVFEECPLGACHQLTFSFFLFFLFFFHCPFTITDVHVILCLTFLGYIVRLQYVI